MEFMSVKTENIETRRQNKMGAYTEINVCFDLSQNASKEAVDILHSLIDGTNEPSALPQHEFFDCDRWSMVARCDSYYFDGSTSSKMKYDTISETWKINIRANLKNYDSEIEKFIDWLAPSIGTNGFIGYMRHEERYDPTLIYIEDGEVAFKSVKVSELPTT